MKKLYSLVLMAAALLIGTNVKAGNFTFTLNGSAQDVSSMSLYQAFTTILNTPNAEAVITLTAAESLAGSPSKLEFNSHQDITFDLAGFNLVDGIRINIKDAKLCVINTAENNAIIDATNCNPDSYSDDPTKNYVGWQAFNTYGVSATDPTVDRDACYFKLGERVVLNVKTYGIAVMPNPNGSTGKPTYGTTVDVYGEIYASEGNGIATNGTMSFMNADKSADTGDKTKCPLINIYPSARIVGSNALTPIVGNGTNKAQPSSQADYVSKYYIAKGGTGTETHYTTDAAVYGPGYAEWNIKGYLAGGVGLYLKSGKYNIDGAEIHATSAEYWEPIAYGNGFIGAGSAIIFDANASYGGDIKMAIEGDTHVSSESGYAIQDAKTTGTTTAVTGITIKSGSFESNSPTGEAITTTPELKDQIVANGSITGGTYNSDITEYLSNVTGVITPVTDEGGNTVYVINEKPAADPWKTTIVGASATDYVRMENGAPVTLSADAQAKYLVMIGTAKIVVPAGKELTVEEIVMGEDAVIEVAAGGKLIVTGAQGVVSNHASNLLLHTEEGNPSYFLLNPAVTANKHPLATVEFISKSFTKSGDNWSKQRFGIPTFGALQSITTKYGGADVQTAIAKYDFSVGDWTDVSWINIDGKEENLDQFANPFEYYQMQHNTPEMGTVVTMVGRLVGNEIPQMNVIAHSWNGYANSLMGTMNIDQVLSSIPNSVQKAIYLNVLNAQNKPQWDPRTDLNAGTYTDIAPMQAFMIRNELAAAAFNVDYEAAVYNPTIAKAPARNRAANNWTKVQILVSGEEYTDNVIVAEGEEFTADFDNGYEAVKYMNDGINMYVSADEKMAHFATNDLNNTFVGLQTINGGNYTIEFANVQGEELTLIDHETGARVAMVEGATYEFTANGTNDYRFEIVGRANMPTAIDNTEAVKSAKGVYTITGQYVGEMNVWNTLPAGVYVVNGEKRVK